MNRSVRFASLLEERGFDAALIHRRQNIRYLTGFTGEGCLFVARDFCAVMTDFRYTEQLSYQAPQCLCVRTHAGKSDAQLLEELCRRAKADVLGVETDFISYDEYVALVDALPDVSIKPLAKLPEEMRAIKDADEFASMEKAAAIACRALENLLPRIRPGMSEREVRIALDYEMLQLGSEEPAFDTIACAGPNGALPHAIPGERKLCPGDLLTLDFGATVNGYRSDMTRTLAIGKISSQLREMYQAVLEANRMALAAVRPGAVCGELDAIARDFLEKDYPGMFGHSLGHGVGLDIHEFPWVRKGDQTVLQPGHVVTIEPGVYIPRLGGCRIEDMVLITEEGLINPSTSPKDLIEL